MQPRNKRRKKRYGRRGKVEKEGGRSGNNSSFHGNCLILGQSSPTSRFVPYLLQYPTDPNYSQCNVAVIIREMVFLSRNGLAGST